MRICLQAARPDKPAPCAFTVRVSCEQRREVVTQEIMAEEVGAEHLTQDRLFLRLAIHGRQLWLRNPPLARDLECRPADSRPPPPEDVPDSQRPVYAGPAANSRVADDHVELWRCLAQLLAEPLHRDEAQKIQPLLPEMYAPLQQLRNAR